MAERQTGQALAERRIPRSLVLIMSSTALPEELSPRQAMRRVVLRATRPALNDLRFKGEADVFADGDEAAVCLGGYAMTRVACTALDVPSLSRAFNDVRTGQARRNLAQRTP